MSENTRNRCLRRRTQLPTTTTLKRQHYVGHTIPTGSWADHGAAQPGNRRATHRCHKQSTVLPLPVWAALLPVRLANGVFGLVCKAMLAPVRATLSQKIPMTTRRHLVLLPERFETYLGYLAQLQARPAPLEYTSVSVHVAAAPEEQSCPQTPTQRFAASCQFLRQLAWHGSSSHSSQANLNPCRIL